MSKVEIYDKAMCCSTRVRGPHVDPVLPKFSADLDWLKSQGHSVVRFNLSQNPAENTKHELVKLHDRSDLVFETGKPSLPIKRKV